MKFLSALTRHGDWGLLVLRLAIGTIFLVHGTMKWAMWSMEPSEQMPASMLTIVRILSVAEPLGGVAVILGFLTPVAGIGLSIVMLGAVNMKVTVMNLGFMEMQDSGWEFEFMILAGTLCLVLSGAGRFSLDRILFKEKQPSVT